MKVSIGVDIGGTNTCIGVVTPDGVVQGRAQFRTDEYDNGTAFADRLAEAVRELIATYQKTSSSATWLGLGIGAPNGNYLSGSIEEPPNLRFKNKIKIIESALPLGDAAIIGAAALVAS